MPWDGVPWFVGGGAEHSADVARLVAYVAFGGSEGVLGSSHLKVRELAVPSTSVRLGTGACSILNLSQGGGQQAFAARLPTEDTAAITATGVGESRSDLVVARVEDPNSASEGWPAPVDPGVGPYIFTRVLEDVPSSTTSLQQVRPNDSGITLARIDIPPSTGTITQSMITDLRQKVLPRRHREVRSWTPSGDTLTQTSYVTWPAGATWQVAVPEWATHAVVFASFGGVKCDSGNVFGGLRVSVGGQVTEGTGYNVLTSGGVDRMTTTLADKVTIPEGIRGTTVTVETQGQRNASSTADLKADEYSSMYVDIEFVEQAS